MSKPFQILQVGTVKGGCKVIEVMNPDATNRADCRYRVERICCGAREIVEHKALMTMETQHRKLCKTCATNAQRARNERGFTMAQARAR